MANTFDKTAKITRDHFVEGYSVRIFIDGEGIRFQRKGDRSRDKKSVLVLWGRIAEIGAECDPNCAGQDFYSYLGLDTQQAPAPVDVVEGEEAPSDGPS